VTIGLEALRRWLESLAGVYSANRELLTELDAAIGDADHGSNMDRGFAAVKAEISEHPPADIRSLLQSAATVLIRTVGGASGPLYGTFFLRAAGACAGKQELDEAGVVDLFRAGIEGVRQRGKAEPGDKTMLDALQPALEAMRKALAESAPMSTILEAGAAAAEQGMLSTIPLQARKGRASYLGPRSTGHQDPGATSSWLLVRAAASALCESAT
jgi:phosphoenolpyruvate---glycerone phosphotransferase subunit DhaL